MTGAFLFASTATAVAATWSGGDNPAQPAAVASAPSSASLQVIRAEQAQDGHATAVKLAADHKAAADAAAKKKAAAEAAAQKAAKTKAAAEAVAKKKAEAARKAAAKAAAKQRQAAMMASSDPHQIAQAMLGHYGWSSGQYSCLNSLWERESNWRVHATNPSSGAYGIAQSLPASKMASAGSDWQNNAATQIKWGLSYIQDRYGSPCGAWSHETSYGWY